MAAITSAQAGDWSATATWTGGIVPGDGDTVTLTHSVTVTDARTVGTSPDDAVTYVVDIQTGGKLTITGATLTIRGNLKCATGSAGSPHAGLALGAGGRLLIDASGSTGGLQVYELKFWNFCYIESRGLPLNRATIESQTGAANAKFTHNTNAYGGLMDAYYTDFVRIGNATNVGWFGNAQSSTGSYPHTIRFHFCTFTDCGQFNSAAADNYATVTWRDCTCSSTAVTTGSAFIFTGNIANTNGVQLIDRCVFNQSKQVFFNARGIKVTNTYFGMRPTCAAPTGTGQAYGQFESNIIAADGQQGVVSRYIGTIKNCIFFENHNLTNFAGPNLSGNYEQCILDGAVMDEVVNDPTPQADYILGQSGSTFSNIVRNCLYLLNPGGYSAGKFYSSVWISIDTTFEFYHNTVGTTAANETGIGFGEISQGSPEHVGEIGAVKSHLFFGGVIDGYKLTRDTSSTFQDHCLAANISNNWAWKIAAGSEGNGFHCVNTSTSMFTDPVPNDNVGTGDPLFVDDTRNVCTYDTATTGLANAAATAWATSTSYAVGDAVSNSDAGFHFSATINFRCVQAHTSGATSEPGVGADWQDYWEPMTLYRMRQDPAQIKRCWLWIRDGFAPQNTGLRNTGHDGVTIGAVEMAPTAPTPVRSWVNTMWFLGDPVGEANEDWAASNYDYNHNRPNVRENAIALGKPQPFIPYVAHATMSSVYDGIYNTWAPSQGIDPEELYLHAYYDITDFAGDGYDILGWGGGSASSRLESRIYSTWSPQNYYCGGFLLPAWRQGFIWYLQNRTATEWQPTYGAIPGGVFFDSWTSPFPTSGRPEFWAEVRDIYGGDVPDYATGRQICFDGLRAMLSEYKTAQRSYFNLTDFPAWPNVGDASAFKLSQLKHAEYKWICNEYNTEAGWLRGSGATATNVLELFKEIYDSMVTDNRRFVMHSETDFSQDYWENTLGLEWRPRVHHQMGGDYLLRHPNSVHGFHIGSAQNYGPPTGNLRDSHWAVNWEYDLGAPVTRAGNDAWGTPNTDRFYIAAENYNGSGDKVLARQFQNGIVIVRFWNTAYSAFGNGPVVNVPLEGTYYLLNLDNTTSSTPVTEFPLYDGHGAILVTGASPAASPKTALILK